MADIDYVQVVKWILIVLSAGFIGQFGKMLATYLIKKARGTKTPEIPQTTMGSVKEPKEVTAVPSLASERKALQGKAEKKASKALIKMKKNENK